MVQHRFIQTVTGKRFYPLEPRAEDVDIKDIAHALSNQCRFAGHVRAFYSVAQHSVIVAGYLPPYLALHGLLHDAAEAYTFDCPAPIKPGFPQFVEIEARILSAVYERFGLPSPSTIDWGMIMGADHEVRYQEQANLMPGDREKKYIIIPEAPRHAKEMFLDTWRDLSAAVT
jgi:5'-deoxynucleotidase YfbR-like HD superfamily hydrolase